MYYVIDFVSLLICYFPMNRVSRSCFLMTRAIPVCKISFIYYSLSGITMFAVITHGDKINKDENAEETRNSVVDKAKKVTKSREYHTFVVQNWVDDNQPDEEGARDVLKIVYTALSCGERSVKARQNTRRQQELKAKRFKSPTESEETTDPNDKNYKYKYNNF